MIPISLSISGFLSYRDPVELDFTGFDLACIAGANGAGKSSLLDAITWALFGYARKRDDSLINSNADLAQVNLTFNYEGNVYRVMRSKPRNKTTQLEFHILQDSSNGNPQQLGSWKPLTERTLRDTDARIQETLRMDYETFVNASFFLQGKADQFTQQRPGDRKRILASILGLETWEKYRQRTGDRRREVESEIHGLNGRLEEIAAELAEGKNRKERLKTLQAELEKISQTRAAQETTLESIRKVIATLAEQERLVEILTRQFDEAKKNLEDLKDRLKSRQDERESFNQYLARSQDIETAYRAWQEARQKLERWEEVAARFREQEKRRQGPLDEINAARARLLQEKDTLETQHAEIQATQVQLAAIEAELGTTESLIKDAEHRLARRDRLYEQLGSAQQHQAEAQAENPRLKAEMDELKERIDQLSETVGATCPLCGQPLNESDRMALIDQLNQEGKEKGDKYRLNRETLAKADELVKDIENQITSLSDSERELRSQERAFTHLSSQLETAKSQIENWEVNFSPRLAKITTDLEQGFYAVEAHQQLSEINEELKAIGYDAAAHDAERLLVNQGSAVEDEMGTLEKARAALAPLQREIADLETQISEHKSELIRKEKELSGIAQALDESQQQAPDLDAAEDLLLIMQEQENQLRMEVGAANQKVLVLDDLKSRQARLDAERNELANQVAMYKQLERAFGKDGIPALLIEQALPQIEAKANEILDRLTMGEMSVRFITQAAYKDKHRDDLRETLEIQISDSAGKRDYEMFSGGEAFRVNFAIRLALSEVLSQRAGARLQTLVIDEGFGSQDAQGRQRLVEAINLVRQDFAKILVITHIDELKDAFPSRIEVEKTSRGSTLSVV